MRPLLAIMALFAFGSASAQTLPNVDIRRYCLKKSMSTGMKTDDFYATCLDAETATYGELKENWSDYSSESRKRCLNIPSSGGYYGDLQACIEAAEALKHTEGR
jgi:hypothetical protein